MNVFVIAAKSTNFTRGLRDKRIDFQKTTSNYVIITIGFCSTGEINLQFGWKACLSIERTKTLKRDCLDVSKHKLKVSGELCDYVITLIE